MRRAALVAGVAALVPLAACGSGDDAAADVDEVACADLGEFVQLATEVRPVLDRVVGPAPRLIDVLLRPWSPGDVATQLMVFLTPEASPDAQAIAEELRATIDVSEVVDVDEARRQVELVLGPDAVAAAEPVGASLRVIAIGAEEADRSAAAVESDPRVRSVVSEADAGPYWGRFAAPAYAEVADELDAVEEEAPADAAADIAELRRLATELNESAAPDLAEFSVPDDTLDVVQRVVDFTQEECNLYVEDA